MTFSLRFQERLSEHLSGRGICRQERGFHRERPPMSECGSFFLTSHNEHYRRNTKVILLVFYTCVGYFWLFSLWQPVSEFMLRHQVLTALCSRTSFCPLTSATILRRRQQTLSVRPALDLQPALVPLTSSRTCSQRTLAVSSGWLPLLLRRPETRTWCAHFSRSSRVKWNALSTSQRTAYG